MMPSRDRAIRWIAVVLLAGVVDAQSLGDVARREAQRRGEAAPAGKVYTNGTLKPDPNAPAPSGDATAAAADSGNATDTAAPSAIRENQTSEPDKPGEPGTSTESVDPAASVKEEPFWRVESYWKTQADAIRAKLSRRNADVLALRQRLTTLPPEDNEFRVTEGALKSAVKSLEAANDEWRRLEELVRIRKVPDAWIR
jgi:hypothetical protein